MPRGGLADPRRDGAMEGGGRCLFAPLWLDIGRCCGMRACCASTGLLTNCCHNMGV